MENNEKKECCEKCAGVPYTGQAFKDVPTKLSCIVCPCHQPPAKDVCGVEMNIGFASDDFPNGQTVFCPNPLPCKKHCQPSVATDTPGGENDHASTDKGWEREFWMLIDSTFEPNISGTDKHPDCVYTLSCVQHGEFGKELLSFIRSLRTQWVKEARVEELEWVLTGLIEEPSALAAEKRIEDRLKALKADLKE